MKNFVIGAREFEPPVFVPSVSSYETQIPPDQGLLIQDAIGEPISLASAFDLKFNGDLPAAARSFRDRQGVLLLDSGGYESSRYNRFSTSSEKNAQWSMQEFLTSVTRIEYDLTFGFDVFPQSGDSPVDYVDRMTLLLADQSRLIPDSQTIPVVHLVNEDGATIFDDKLSADVIRRVDDQWEAKFIAIPERELGVGIIERAVLARKLVRALNGSDCRLHALGCGNPLSVALLGVAGISMMDGLEWCRTVVGPEDTHLHHFQQLELFEADLTPFDLTAAMMYNANANYTLRTALHNLVFLREFMERLRESMRLNNVNDFLTSLYGTGVAKALRAIENA